MNRIARIITASLSVRPSRSQVRPIATAVRQVVLKAGLVLCIAAASAQDKAPAPPYQIAGSNHVIVGVAWDEAAVRKALPPGIKPVAGAAGAINIYTASRGYGIAPYSSVYFWVDVEGFDSPDGTKGRWMLVGAYGPNDVTSQVLRDMSFFPVRNGTSRAEATADGKRAIGTVNGQDVVVAEIKSSTDPCDTVSGLLNYPVINNSKQIMVNIIPYVGDACKAEPVSVSVTAPAGDPFAAFNPVKVLWAAEFKNAAFSFHRPVAAK